MYKTIEIKGRRYRVNVVRMREAAASAGALLLTMAGALAFLRVVLDYVMYGL